VIIVSKSVERLPPLLVTMRTRPDYKKFDFKKIFLDRDGDGITDSVDLQLHLFPSCSHPTVLSAIMDLSACLGFETMGMNLPLVEPGEERDSSFNHHLYIGLDQELKKFDTFDAAKPRFLNRGKKRRSVSTLSIPRASDRGVEWVNFHF